MSYNNSVLTRIFTQNSLKELILNNEAPMLDNIVRRYDIKYDGNTKYEEIISEIYQYLGKNYRNEYYYKNTLLNKLIISAHKVKSTIALTEVPIAKSKADIIMINGKAVVYEIKTELDSFDRLQTQINDYYKAFDYVCVVTDESRLKSLQQLLHYAPVGIYVLSKRGAIHKIKEPEEYNASLDKGIIYKILNKPEYEEIIKEKYGTLPEVTPVNYYRECKRLFCELPIETAYSAFLAQLKKRSRIENINFSGIPYSLRFLVYFSKYNSNGITELMAYLNQTYKEGH